MRTKYAGMATLLQAVSHRLWQSPFPGTTALSEFVRKISKAVTGADIAAQASLHSTVRIPHPAGVVVGEATVGPRTVLQSGVVVGLVGTGEKPDGYATIGSDVLVGTGAKILGPVNLGDGARIGANAVVLNDVPAHATVVGVPGRVVKIGPTLKARTGSVRVLASAPLALRQVFAWAFVPVEHIDSPNLKRKGLWHRSAADAFDQYYVCLAVSCASARRWHPDARLVLFTPGAIPTWFQQVQTRLNVEIVAVPFRHMLPNAQQNRYFIGSTYTLDAIDWIAQHGSQQEIWVLLDPDTVMLGSLDAARWASSLGHLAWPLASENPNNGLGRAQYQNLRPVFGLRDSDDPTLVGGEFLAGGKDVFCRLNDEIAKVWKLNLALADGAEYPLTTEEHVLSMLLPRLSTDNSRDVADRIWTQASYRTVDGTEDRLLIWHLPGEKGRGFRQVLPATRNPDSWFWTTPSRIFLAEIGKRMSVTQRSSLRRMRDRAGQIKRRMRDRAGQIKQRHRQRRT